MDSALLPFGRHSSGRMVTVEEVPRGRSCDCVCPHCGQPLEARKGDIREHYFAHQPGYDACESGVESAIHQMAKQILADEMGMFLPELAVEETARDDAGRLYEEREDIVTATWLGFDRVAVEERLDPRRPDLIGYYDGQALLIEIAVTNFTDTDKRSWFLDNDHAAIEIDLSGMSRANSAEDLRTALVEQTECKKWLSNPAESEARRRLRDRLRERVDEANREIVKKRKEKDRAAPPPPPAESRRPKEPTPAPVQRSVIEEYNPRWFCCESCRHIWTVPLSEAPYSLRTVRCPECDFDVSCEPFVR